MPRTSANFDEVEAELAGSFVVRTASRECPHGGRPGTTYELGSSGLVSGPELLSAAAGMCLGGETLRGIKLFAAMYGSVPIADALAILGIDKSGYSVTEETRTATSVTLTVMPPEEKRENA